MDAAAPQPALPPQQRPGDEQAGSDETWANQPLGTQATPISPTTSFPRVLQSNCPPETREGGPRWREFTGAHLQPAIRAHEALSTPRPGPHRYWENYYVVSSRRVGNSSLEGSMLSLALIHHGRGARDTARHRCVYLIQVEAQPLTQQHTAKQIQQQQLRSDLPRNRRSQDLPPRSRILLTELPRGGAASQAGWPRGLSSWAGLQSEHHHDPPSPNYCH